MEWNITATFDESGVIQKFENLIDDNVMLEIHTLFAKLINEYVPAKSGRMADADITSEFVRYPGPYAHYQYMGEVYGPNIPIIQGGQVVGWRSIAPKHPTGRKLGTEGELYDDKGNVIWKFGYTKDMHPLASAKWDKVAMHAKMPLFERGVKEILVRRARDLFG